MSIEDLIKKNRTRIFRRAFIRRRLAGSGQFESDWLEITSDVVSWGSIKTETETERFNRFRLGSVKLTVRNDDGRFNDETDENSYWFGYASRNRTLLRIDAGFINETLGADGIWDQVRTPTGGIVFDESLFDTGVFDDVPSVFIGIINGDIPSNSQNKLTINAQPLSQVFKDFPAKNLTGYTSTGMTSSQFVTMIRDQQDGSGNYIFRPFFANTTSSWVFTTTGVVYGNLNTSGAAEVIDKNVWDILENLAEAENSWVYVRPNGEFNFRQRAVSATTTAFHFFGPGYFSSDYGCTIKNISKLAPAVSKYYSQVQLKWVNTDTTTSYESTSASLEVSGNNAVWNLGFRAYNFENFWIPSAAVAASVVNNVFNNLSSLKREIEFTTSFIPHLEPRDIVSVSYDAAGAASATSAWDLADWADTAGSLPLSTDLIWDGSRGNALKLNAEEFYVLSVELGLDSLETKFICRET